MQSENSMTYALGALVAFMGYFFMQTINSNQAKIEELRLQGEQANLQRVRDEALR
jgi:hypothetical protein